MRTGETNTGAAARVLVLGDYRQTVTVIRSLARAGYAVTLGTTDPRSSTTRSRYVDALWVYEGHDAASIRDQLEAYLHAEAPDYVFTVGESLLRLIAADSERFANLATWVSPAWPTLLQCFDKHAMYTLAGKLGIPTPAFRTFSNAAELRRAAQHIGFPVVLKRRDSSAQVCGRKAVICADAASFEACLAGVLREPNPRTLLLQKYASGLRHNCHFAASRGRLAVYFEQQVVRTDEPDLTGIGVEGLSVPPSPDLYVHCARLVRSLGYHGIGCIQFIVDRASGSVAFLELNARMDSTAALPYRLGYDFPRLAVELAGDRERFPRIGRRYPCGKRYHWLYGDVLALQDAAKRGQQSVLQLAAWVIRSGWIALTSHHLTWDFRDPIPTVDLFWKKIAGAAAKRLRPILA